VLRLAASNALPGIVTNTRSYSAGQSVELPFPSGGPSDDHSALEPREFLQSARPFVEGYPDDYTAAWIYQFTSIPGFNYRLQHTAQLDDPILWIDGTTVPATEQVTSVTLPKRSDDSTFVRILREEQ